MYCLSLVGCTAISVAIIITNFRFLRSVSDRAVCVGLFKEWEKSENLCHHVHISSLGRSSLQRKLKAAQVLNYMETK